VVDDRVLAVEAAQHEVDAHEQGEQVHEAGEHEQLPEAGPPAPQQGGALGAGAPPAVVPFEVEPLGVAALARKHGAQELRRAAQLRLVPVQAEQHVVARGVGHAHDVQDGDHCREQQPVVPALRVSAVGDGPDGDRRHVVVPDPVQVRAAGARRCAFHLRPVARDLAVGEVDDERQLQQREPRDQHPEVVRGQHQGARHADQDPADRDRVGAHARVQEQPRDLDRQLPDHHGIGVAEVARGLGIPALTAADRLQLANGGDGHDRYFPSHDGSSCRLPRRG